MDLNLLLNPNIPNKVNTLSNYVATVLLVNYVYFIVKICRLPDYIISEEFSVNQFEANLLVNVNNVENAKKWFADFEEVSKTTMPQTKGYQLKGQKATIHLRIEQKNLQTDYPLEVNIKYTHNHVVHSAKALSFRHVKDEVWEICYVDASASFEPLNTSITLFYTSCIAGALPFGLIIISDELEITLEKEMTMLKSFLPQCAFFGWGPNLGPITFLTDDSNSERVNVNANVDTSVGANVDTNVNADLNVVNDV
ncbi:37834_t:CDS:2 [Gigaspora margarita]|uniref:37834_t:CDS:1 n=1 Tax=Gigaspora margarita TaxID=4874 RepID=A0ABN7VWM5_GIGMA|nr:37834_t:CDS:2 [Gigaspora margarita]